MAQAMTKETPFVFHIDRVFDAPRDRVWKAWTDPDLFSQWFGPKGCVISYMQIDLKPGGAYRYGMEFNGFKMWGQWAFKEIKAPEKLVAIVSFTDEQGTIIEHPGMKNWPRKILSTVTFTEEGRKTRVSVAWTAHEATDLERQTFEDGASSMQQGWGGTFEQLEEFLAGWKGGDIGNDRE